MNPAIRAVVRMGLYAGAKVFAIWEVSSPHALQLKIQECLSQVQWSGVRQSKVPVTSFNQ